MKHIKVMLLISVIVNVTAIPWLIWQVMGVSMMYTRNVDYCSELAYAIGYHKAKNSDMKEALEAYSTRLPVTRIDDTYVEAAIWPAKDQYIRIAFSDERICYANIFTKEK